MLARRCSVMHRAAPTLRVVPQAWPCVNAEKRPTEIVRGPLLPVMASTVWTVTAVTSMANGTGYSEPDYGQVNCGVPLAFATDTLNTTGGPTDGWSPDPGALAPDLAFVPAGVAAISLAAPHLEGHSSQSRRRDL